MNDTSDIYAFVFKGSIAQDAIDRELTLSTDDAADAKERIVRAMPFDAIGKDYVGPAAKMAQVYIAIAAFENAARKFIQDRLLEEFGADWWVKKISQSIQDAAAKKKKDEEQHRYHGSRGNSMIFYSQLGDLVSIMQGNEAAFADYVPSVEWARQLFKSLERSRNVIMHSGELSMNDIERVAMNIRDWIRQVGG